MKLAAGLLFLTLLGSASAQSPVFSPTNGSPSSCLSAATISSPCVAFAGSFTALGATGTTGVKTLYTSNAPAGAVFQFCPFTFQSTAGTAGTISMQVTYTTPGGNARSNSNVGGTSVMTGTGLVILSCAVVAVQANSSLSFAVLATGGTGTPVWETDPVVTRIN